MTAGALRALLFDVDGTLTETERDGHRPACNATFAEFGPDWVWDETTAGRLLAASMLRPGAGRSDHPARLHAEAQSANA